MRVSVCPKVGVADSERLPAAARCFVTRSLSKLDLRPEGLQALAAGILVCHSLRELTCVAVCIVRGGVAVFERPCGASHGHSLCVLGA